MSGTGTSRTPGRCAPRLNPVSENNVNNDPWARAEPDAAPTVPAQPVTPPTGWYPDPADAQRQRYWDGTNWTAETRPLNPEPAAPQPIYPTTPAYGQNTPGYPAQAPAAQPPYGTPASGAYSAPTQPSIPTAPAYPAANPAPWNTTPGTPVAPPVASAPPVYPAAGPNGYMGTPAPGGYDPYARIYGPKTADGVPLAGWWWRVLATIVDNIIISIVAGQIINRLLFDSTSTTNSMTAWAQSLQTQAINATSMPSLTPPVDVVRNLAGPGLVQVLILVIYSFIMLWKAGGTVGQLACRLRVVPVGQGMSQHGLPVGQALGRALAYGMLSTGLWYLLWLAAPSTFWLGVTLMTIVFLLCVLWAAWDSKKQAWHDKIAHTQVIRLP